ncbi:hypothetical protein BaRGS_00031553, partial [Batillaria attramentaria]
NLIAEQRKLNLDPLGLEEANLDGFFDGRVRTLRRRNGRQWVPGLCLLSHVT